MNKLTIINLNGQLLIDSREVAAMTGKEHKNLLRDIKGYIKVLDGSRLSTPEFFVESTYLNSQNKEQPCYLLTKKGCDMVANKMIGEKGILFTAEYVTAFEAMANQLATAKQIQVPQTLQEALRAYADTLDEKEKLEAENKVLAPKAEKHDRFMDADGAIDVGEASKTLKARKGKGSPMGRNKLFDYLRSKKLLMDNNVPYQTYVSEGLFRTLPEVTVNNIVVSKTVITPKGMDKIADMLIKDGYTLK